MRQSREHHLRAITVLHVRGMYDGDEYKAHHVDEQMPLPAVYLLPRVVAMDPPFSVVLTD